jgi:hypothetical protein
MSLMMPRSVPGLQVFAAVHRNDHPAAVGSAIVNGVAAPLTIEHKFNGFGYPNNLPGADRRGLGHLGSGC